MDEPTKITHEQFEKIMQRLTELAEHALVLTQLANSEGTVDYWRGKRIAFMQMREEIRAIAKAPNTEQSAQTG